MLIRKIILGIIFLLPVTAHNETLTPTQLVSLLSKQESLISKQELVGYKPYKKVLDEKQLKCLTDNVYFEAGNEESEGKIAVALVTLNRLNHDHFPNSICEIVYQRTRWKCQFTWVCSKNRRVKYWSNYFQSKKIAEYVMMNYDIIDDNTNGAIFFHQKKIPYPFIRIKVKRTALIGKHIFYKL
jgi:N-acetylmuramoyl-L-alanine amidase